MFSKWAHAKDCKCSVCLDTKEPPRPFKCACANCRNPELANRTKISYTGIPPPRPLLGVERERLSTPASKPYPSNAQLSYTHLVRKAVMPCKCPTCNNRKEHIEANIKPMIHVKEGSIIILSPSETYYVGEQIIPDVFIQSDWMQLCKDPIQYELKNYTLHIVYWTPDGLNTHGLNKQSQVAVGIIAVNNYVGYHALQIIRMGTRNTYMETKNYRLHVCIV
jgi:hypothetical protein